MYAAVPNSSGIWKSSRARGSSAHSIVVSVVPRPCSCSASWKLCTTGYTDAPPTMLRRPSSWSVASRSPMRAQTITIAGCSPKARANASVLSRLRCACAPSMRDAPDRRRST